MGVIELGSLFHGCSIHTYDSSERDKKQDRKKERDAGHDLSENKIPLFKFEGECKVHKDRGDPEKADKVERSERSDRCDPLEVVEMQNERARSSPAERKPGPKIPAR